MFTNCSRTSAPTSKAVDERLAGIFGIRVADTGVTTHLVNCLLDRAFDGTGFAHQLAEHAVVVDGSQRKQLAGNVLVVAFLCEFVGDIEQVGEILAHVQVTGGAVGEDISVRAGGTIEVVAGSAGGARWSWMKWAMDRWRWSWTW